VTREIEMRHELYADSLDVVKWTAVVRAARANGCRRVVHVAMLRPDVGAGEGLKAFEPNGADPIVLQFFENERSRRERSGAVLSLSDIEPLGHLMDPALSIEVFDSPFDHARRDAYFDGLHASFGNDSRELGVLFLDPDTGISAQGSDEHVSAPHVVALARALNRRGVLLVYSHRGRYEQAEQFKGRIEKVLGEAATPRRLALDHFYANDGLVTSVAIKPVANISPAIRKKGAG
jgi:hypothetical protein